MDSEAPTAVEPTSPADTDSLYAVVPPPAAPAHPALYVLVLPLIWGSTLAATWSAHAMMRNGLPTWGWSVCAVVAGVLTLVVWREIRCAGGERLHSREVLAGLRSSELLTSREMCGALLNSRSCAPHDSRRLRRADIEKAERATGRRVPMLWFVGAEAARPFVDSTMLSAEHGVEPRAWEALAERGPAYERLALPVVVGLAVVAVGCYLAFLPQLSHTPPWAVKLVAIAVGGSLLAGWGWIWRRAGWRLICTPERADLVRCNRAGMAVEQHAIDINDTLVIVHPAGQREHPGGGSFGTFIWRFVPPEPVRSFEVGMFDPVGTPWEALVLEAADGLRADPPPDDPKPRARSFRMTVTERRRARKPSP